HGPIPLGEARITSAGKLQYKAIIHVAGINMFWFATEYSVRKSVRSSVEISKNHNLSSIALPLIGSGSGNRGRKWSKGIIEDELLKIESGLTVLVVEYKA